jgi:uncharacterized protein
VGALFWIARAIILLVILRVLLRMLFSPGSRGGGGPRSAGPMPRPTERVGGELVRDPQCGTYVPRTRAIAVVRGGETLYFCSAKCRDEYGREI